MKIFVKEGGYKTLHKKAVRSYNHPFWGKNFTKRGVISYNL